MVIEEIAEKYKLEGIETADGIPSFYCHKNLLLDVLSELNKIFEVLLDITAVDYLNKKEKRFEVVYLLLSIKNKTRLRLKVPVQDGEKVPTASLLWKNANWLEREVYDMFGIEFEGHPDLRRILLYPEFEGHPLRKDYPLKRSQPRIKLLRPERE